MILSGARRRRQFVDIAVGDSRRVANPAAEITANAGALPARSGDQPYLSACSEQAAVDGERLPAQADTVSLSAASRRIAFRVAATALR
jgi:hypothetical protein